ncbi:MAG: hypothetical protein Q7K47_07350 [Fusobacterium sp. JB019]|nr:hypothetical protein [Fusobacterium sp. JB019]
MLKNNKQIIYIVFSKSDLKIYNNNKQIIFKFYLNKLDHQKIYNKIKKYIVKKEIIICFEEGAYIKKEILEEEVFKIENYIQELCMENLKKETDDLFIETYKLNQKYIIYIFERDFMEKIIEIFIKNRISVKGIYIDIDLKNKIDDYDLILNQIKRINFNLILSCMIIIIVFLGIKIFENKLFNIIKNIKEQNCIIKNENYQLKNQINKKNSKNKNVNKTKEIKSIKNNIKRNFFLVLSYINRDIIITKYNIYNIKIKLEGYVMDEKKLFKFMEKIESDKNVKSLKYDYIEKKENKYIFCLEIEVI